MSPFDNTNAIKHLAETWRHQVNRNTSQKLGFFVPCNHGEPQGVPGGPRLTPQAPALGWRRSGGFGGKAAFGRSCVLVSPPGPVPVSPVLFATTLDNKWAEAEEGCKVFYFSKQLGTSAESLGKIPRALRHLFFLGRSCCPSAGTEQPAQRPLGFCCFLELFPAPPGLGGHSRAAARPTDCSAVTYCPGPPGNGFCKEHTATCSSLEDVCEGVSKIHFPKSSGQASASGNPGEGGQSLGNALVPLSSPAEAPGKLEAPRTPHPLQQSGQRMSQCSHNGGGSGSGCVSLVLPGESGECTSQGQI
nr:uncharacterized protein LOC110356848 [Columba livia]